jgi:hypothetical protein
MSDFSIQSSALDSVNISLSQLNQKVITGSFTPTAAATYSVVDSNGVALQLPVGTLVKSVLLRATTPLVGGTNAKVELSTTATGTGTDITATATTANMNNGIQVARTSPLVAGAANETFVVATTTGTFTSGKCGVTLYYL